MARLTVWEAVCSKPCAGALGRLTANLAAKSQVKDYTQVVQATKPDIMGCTNGTTTGFFASIAVLSATTCSKHVSVEFLH